MARPLLEQNLNDLRNLLVACGVVLCKAASSKLVRCFTMVLRQVGELSLFKLDYRVVRKAFQVVCQWRQAVGKLVNVVRIAGTRVRLECTADAGK